MTEQTYQIESDRYATYSEPVTLAEFGAMCRELGWDVPVLRETTRGLVDRETGELVLSPVEV